MEGEAQESGHQTTRVQDQIGDSSPVQCTSLPTATHAAKSTRRSVLQTALCCQCVLFQNLHAGDDACPARSKRGGGHSLSEGIGMPATCMEYELIAQPADIANLLPRTARQ